MNERCPDCGLRFERAPGYFGGAMYVSYAFSVALLAAFAFAIWLVTGWPAGRLALSAGLAYLPLVPAVFRYSRVIWIHVDRSAG